MSEPFSIFQQAHLKELSTMIPIEGGTFLMGSDDEKAYDREKPAHKVKLANFAIGKYPVTQALWQQVITENPSYFKGEKRPVEQVSWYDAVIFCNALNEACGYTPCYFSDKKHQTPFGKTAKGYELLNKGKVFYHVVGKCYRLPTEAEWEYAAKGGNKKSDYVYAGGDKLNEVAWYRGNSHRETKAIGLKLPNELGLYDMSGNVWEWCWDWFDSDYYKACAAEENGTIDNPKGLEIGSDRVLRGGSWSDYSVYCRSTFRFNDRPGFRGSGIGFRLVLSSLPV